ncbi:PD40 domain-containing protein [candidate division KSB1 bacterium]|nr:PD40 domain-containing protein [candidate division KSB1 bacterium]
MKIKNLFTFSFVFLLLWINSGAEASGIKVIKKATAITDGSLYFMSPRWSPDGKKLAFTETKYNGIWVLELRNKNFIQVTDEPGAGFGFQWSMDSKEILCRVSKQEGYRRYHAVKIFNIETDVIQQLTDYRSLMTALPHWTKNDREVYLASNKGLEFFQVENRSQLTSFKKPTSKQKNYYVNEKGINIQKDNKLVSTQKPVEGQYLNAVISPDGDKIAFEILGGNMYVLDLNKRRTKDLGIGYNPQWSPDNRKLVYMITEDDGHNFTKSDVYVININGTGKTNLTNTSDLLEQNPSWSPNGKKIAFDELNSGKIYVIEIAEKKKIIRLEK